MDIDARMDESDVDDDVVEVILFFRDLIEEIRK